MGRSNVTFTNSTEAKISVAYKRLDYGCQSRCGHPWDVLGWINLEPGERKSRANPTKNRWFYYYAEDVDGRVWSGSSHSEVTDARFEKCTCLDPDTDRYYFVGFQKLDTNTYSGVNFITSADLPRNCNDYRGATLETSKWNDGGQIQCKNNCYNYACNTRTDSFAQPGLGGGFVPHKIDCVYYSQASTADGLSTIDCDKDCPGSLESPRTCHKVALVIAPGIDFHWYRLDNNGYWSHKPGRTKATNKDNSGNLIKDPRTADRGPYTEFCGCFCVCRCSYSIRGNGNPSCIQE